MQHISRITRVSRALALATLFGIGTATAQAHHEPVYVVGGRAPTTNPQDTQGVLALDMRGPAPVMTSLLATGHYARFGMDADNEHILVGIQGAAATSTLFAGLKAGLYRYHPVSGRLTTIHALSTQNAFDSVFNVEIDHNGAYICQVHRYDSGQPANTGYSIWRIAQSGNVTTLLTTPQLGRAANLSGKMTTDIRTGNVLIGDLQYQSSPSTVRYPILSLNSETGRVDTWNTGGSYGWYSYYGLTQSHRSGAIEGPYANAVYRVDAGTVGRTTIATPTNLPYGVYGAGKFDLQTAANPRYVALSYAAIGQTQSYLYHFDAKTWAVTSIVPLSTMRTYNYSFEFYRGRHTQAVQIVPSLWQIRLSSPNHAGKAYAMAASLSGAYPGIAVGGGRQVNLNFDGLTFLTMNNMIPQIFNPGPGILDAKGVAAATLDLGRFGKIGAPLWISWVVIDPQAPNGIAYMPDTYVMRI